MENSLASRQRFLVEADRKHNGAGNEIAMFHRMFTAAHRSGGRWAVTRLVRLLAMSALLTLCCQPSVLAG
jgi:hypothetical protein